MLRNCLFVTSLLVSMSLFAQDDLINKVIKNASVNSKFEFEDIINLERTSVKSQGSAGTCWSYSGNSFLESEMIKKGKQPVDLAEIFSARYVYLGKARNYVLFNGNLGLGDGGETHDVMNMLRKYGAMPQQAYTMEDYGKGVVKSDEFQAKFKEILDNYIKDPGAAKVSWVKQVNDYMDEKLGKIPDTFTFAGKTYTPMTFAKEVVGINPDDYMEFSSYKDSPYYTKIVLPVPDNWCFDQLINVPMKEMTDIIDYALSKGYTIAWSSDVSEPYFSWRNGVAFVPNVDDLYKISEEQRKTMFDGPSPEKEITEDLRLDGLYNLQTTDDHAMQIVGLAKDQNGREYYKVKNSWGETNDYKGYLYVTKAFVQLKSTGILLNKAGVPKTTKAKLKV